MKKDLLKIFTSLIILVFAKFIKFNYEWINIILFIISYLIVGYKVIIEAIENIFKKEFFDENFLMSVATIGAFFIGEYPEAIAVMVFYQIGEMFQEYAVDKSKKSITSLMNMRPDYANLYLDGEVLKKNPNEINIGDVIIINPGEKIPLDGKIIEGNSMLDMSALTGESLPKNVEENEEVLSGCVNINGVLKIKVNKKYEDSTVNKILDLVQNATEKKASAENFITSFSKVYTPIVVILAIAIAIIPPIIIKDALWSDWIYRALTFLVVSCPCAMVISIPLSFFGGIGGASKKGILIKGGNYLEALSKAGIIVFDKTGTLTKGVFEVQEINSLRLSNDELLEIAAYAENYSNHPIALSIKKAYGKKIDTSVISDIEEIAGNGIKCKVKGKTIFVGNEKLMNKINIDFPKNTKVGTVIFVVIDEQFEGYIVISDEIKDSIKDTLTKLKSRKIRRTVMLTGDTYEVAEEVSKKIGIDEFHAGLLPSDKVNELEKILNSKRKDEKVLFVGDGINDAPVLAIADVGIAMGGIGADAAIEAADVVIMNDEISKLNIAIKISRNTLKIVKQNVIFALLVKVLVLILSAFGVANMWEAVFADVGVTLVAILSSFRALKVK
ncbi:MAG: heavy metal translocating P-type ATPase [Candidatus Scatovivens sp.]